MLPTNSQIDQAYDRATAFGCMSRRDVDTLFRGDPDMLIDAIMHISDAHLDCTRGVLDEAIAGGAVIAMRRAEGVAPLGTGVQARVLTAVGAARRAA